MEEEYKARRMEQMEYMKRCRADLEVAMSDAQGQKDKLWQERVDRLQREYGELSIFHIHFNTC